MRSICPAVTREQSPTVLRHSNVRLDFPGPTQEASWIPPRRNSRIPPQLEKNHVVPPPSQDEALSRDGVSREVPRAVLKFETVLGSLDATHKVPRHTGLPREEHRGSRHHFIWAPAPLLISTGGSISLVCLEGVPNLPVAPQDEASLKKKFETWPCGWCHFLKDPDFLVCSWWESDARIPLPMQTCEWSQNTKGHWHLHASSKKTHRFQIQLDKLPVTPRTTEEASGVPCLDPRKSWLSCPNSAGTLRSESEMERNPEVPASTGDEALF